MMMTSDKLKPCPFCGGKAELHAIDFDEWQRHDPDCIWYVRCNECGACTDEYTGEAEAEAVAAWNTRARDCDECQLGAVPATEENMAKRGWFRERTCHIVERPDGFGSSDCVCSECGEDYIFGRYCAGCGAKVVEE